MTNHQPPAASYQPPTSAGQHTHAEILSQPEVWATVIAEVRAQAQALKDFWRAGQFDSIAFTGCGSTYYLSLASAAFAQTVLGIPARGWPASELWLNPSVTYPAKGRTLFVAVSRSGETTETINAIESFSAQARGAVLTLSCYSRPAWTKLGNLGLVFPAAQEQSIAQTRAFSSLYLATALLASIWAERDDLLDEFARLPEVGRRLLTDYAPLMARLGRAPEFDRYYFLGSGVRYGLACEISLKMKEMSLSHSEPFHFMEFRHGPKSMVTPSTLMVGFLSEANQTAERAVLEDMRALGAQVLSIGDREADVTFASGITELARDPLYLPLGQLLAFEHALSKNLDPDHPKNLDTVVRLS